MDDQSSVESRVIRLVIEKLCADNPDAVEITRDTSFVNDLNADSLDTVELVMKLEEEFDLEIPDEISDKIATVGDAIDHIEQAL